MAKVTRELNYRGNSKLKTLHLLIQEFSEEELKEIFTEREYIILHLYYPKTYKLPNKFYEKAYISRFLKDKGYIYSLVHI
ncbi:hypothetical protein [Aneurinibacillus tyrosinisolvens]|uniref:hypothetical protein n=1 Tax=Aneurinibacillus tyrosinisolvens TaxID=1443435 RepID=UPI00063F55BE|nr:hypothetical protein [Aneurinibacillus tyrosinisolvens]